MNVFTIQDIRDLRPCYDPSRYLPEDWRGTALDVLHMEQVPPNDRLWVVCHVSWIDDRTLRLFAVWCARQATQEELAAAPLAAWAAGDAAWIAGDAAWIAAWNAASIAAGDAARDTAYSAVRDAQVRHLIEMLEAP